ncbi:MAG: adenylate kinase family protein [Planctomycetota bacterium]
MAGKYRSVLLFGAPGVGKGTQGKLLGQIPGFVHMASGDMFRSLDKSTDLARKCREYSSKDRLVPDDVTIDVWEDHARRQVEQGAYRPDVDLLVLDGIPRNVDQCKALEKHIEVLQVMHLAAPSVDEMVQRLKGRALKEGRADDADEAVIRRRFEVYGEETAPMLGYYDASLVSETVAVGLPAEILMNVLQAIVPVYSKQFGNPLG